MIETITNIYNYLTDFNFVSGTVRLVLAMICGGLIGYGRGKKHRAAGTRTYIMVCLGAALSILLAFSFDGMLKYVWPELLTTDGVRPNTDVSRFGAMVISGIGFLGAGTIIVTSTQKVQGVTTAAGLFAAACMGFAIGAGYYPVALICCLMMWLTMTKFDFIEKAITSNTRNMNVFVVLRDINDIGTVVNAIRKNDIQIYDIETKKSEESYGNNPAAVLALRLPKRQHHALITSQIAAIDEVVMIEEV